MAGGAPTLGLDQDSALAIVRAGFSAWPNVECEGGFPSIALSSTEPISCDEPEYNPEGPNANAVIFREREWPHDPFALALTTVSFNADTGKLLDADMEINAFAQLIFASSLEYVIAHEAGHFLGLDHSNDAEALMYERYSPFAMSGALELGADDSAGMCRAYPPTLETAARCDPEPERGFAPECGGDIEGSCGFSAAQSPASPTLVTLVFFAGVLFRRRSQSRAHPT